MACCGSRCSPRSPRVGCALPFGERPSARPVRPPARPVAVRSRRARTARACSARRFLPASFPEYRGEPRCRRRASRRHAVAALAPRALATMLRHAPRQGGGNAVGPAREHHPDRSPRSRASCAQNDRITSSQSASSVSSRWPAAQPVPQPEKAARGPLGGTDRRRGRGKCALSTCSCRPWGRGALRADGAARGRGVPLGAVAIKGRVALYPRSILAGSLLGALRLATRGSSS